MTSQHWNNINLHDSSSLVDPLLSNSRGVHEMGFPILGHPSSSSSFQRRDQDKDGDNNNGFLSFIKLGEEKEEENKAEEANNKRNGRTKVCARGHWRPAEDSKLKELVSQYGPQNWNLIAHHLQGRSGKKNPEKKLTPLFVG